MQPSKHVFSFSLLFYFHLQWPASTVAQVVEIVQTLWSSSVLFDAYSRNVFITSAILILFFSNLNEHQFWDVDQGHNWVHSIDDCAVVVLGRRSWGPRNLFGQQQQQWHSPWTRQQTEQAHQTIIEASLFTGKEYSCWDLFGKWLTYTLV